MKVPRPPKSRFERATWWARSPLVAALLLAGLVAALSSLDATLAGVAARLTGVNRDLELTARTEYLHRDASGQFDVINTNVESMDRLLPLIQTDSHNLLIAESSIRIETIGWAFPAWREVTREVSVRPVRSIGPDGAPSFDAPALAEGERVFADWLRRMEGPESWAGRMGDQRWLEELIVPNLLKTAGLVVLVLLVVASWAGVPRFVRVWMAARRLEDGKCGVCLYDLRGMGAEGPVRCPECGVEWRARGGVLGFAESV